MSDGLIVQRLRDAVESLLSPPFASYLTWTKTGSTASTNAMDEWNGRVAAAKALLADPDAAAGEDRYQQAVDVVLSSGLLTPHMTAFWAYVDGEIDMDALTGELR